MYPSVEWHAIPMQYHKWTWLQLVEGVAALLLVIVNSDQKWVHYYLPKPTSMHIILGTYIANFPEMVI